jgi:hypothetical protein
MHPAEKKEQDRCQYCAADLTRSPTGQSR